MLQARARDASLGGKRQQPKRPAAPKILRNHLSERKTAPAVPGGTARSFPAWTCPLPLHTSHFSCRDQPLAPAAHPACTTLAISTPRPEPLLPGSASPEPPCSPWALPPHPGFAHSECDRRAEARWDGGAGAQAAWPLLSHGISPPPGPQGRADARLRAPVTLPTRVPTLGCIPAGSQH